MRRISLGLLLIALTTLMVELALVRVFDVIWHSNMAYMIITMVMFCFGLSGVYLSLRPINANAKIEQQLSRLSLLFGLSVLILLPAMNLLSIDFDGYHHTPLKTSLNVFAMYLIVAIPFFIAGLILSTLFSRFSEKIQVLYFWDLVGAGAGCLLLIPLLPIIGPGGILFVGSGLGFFAGALFIGRGKTSFFFSTIAIALLIAPFYKAISADDLSDRYFDFKHHIDKRGVKKAIERGKLEISYWDPISKVDIVHGGRWKHVAYDGGSQSSFIFPFSGDFEKLRNSLPKYTTKHFGGQNVYISHAIKEGSSPKVLIIGSAAGQETKAALTFGASHIDSVELVGFVIEAGKTHYRDYNGGIFNHPNVFPHRGEGRSFLRSSNDVYDIIQIYSNHTSSSIAAGSGAMATTYLQTTDAYKEYFSHLSDDGILHINHHIYPRMVTTASKAWKELGRSNFRKHVLVFSVKNVRDNLPTLLIRMTPWSKEEVDTLRNFFEGNTTLVEDPFNPEKSMLTDEFYSGELSASTIDLVPYRVTATTDDRPYFNFLRKEWVHYKRAHPEKFMDYSTAALLSSQYVIKSKVTGEYEKRFIPTDVVHLFVTSAASLFFALVFVLTPLLFAKAGRVRWPGKFYSLGYFSCLGAGFIMIELVLIQVFMKLIGFPLYTYSVVVFALLVSSGLGSYCSNTWQITPDNKWKIPFLGVFITIVTFLLTYEPLFSFFLTYPVLVRIIAATFLLIPVGFFMGMCFPLGIMTIQEQPNGAISWAWGMNGLFTVIGGISSVLISIYLGFTVTLITGLTIYVLAFFLYSKLKTSLKV